MCQGLSPDRQPHLADGELWLRDAQKLGQGRRADNGQNCDEDRVCLTPKPLPCLECLWPHVGPAFIRCLQPPSFTHNVPNLPVFPSLPLPFPMIPFLMPTSFRKPSLPVITGVRY